MLSSIFTLRQAEFSDFEVLRDAVQDAPIDIVQLGPGKMAGNLLHMSVGSLGISSGSFTRGLRQRGALSERRWVFGTVTAPALMLQYEMTPSDLLILAPDHELYSSFSGANNYTTILVEPDELFAFIASQPGAQDLAVWHQPMAMLTTTDPAIAAARAERLRTLLLVLSNHGGTMSAEVADFYRRCMLELITAPVLDGIHYRDPRLRSAGELVRKVDRFLVDAGARPVHISELCAEFGMTRRTLYRAFAEVHGMSPRQFHQRKRLGDAHNALLMAVPGDTVTKIAIKHGFPHGGRFAQDYHSLFGELPGETLRRPAPRSMTATSAHVTARRRGGLISTV